MQVNCIIIEDEPLAQERIRTYTQKLPFLNLLSTFDNAIDALGFLGTNDVDLIFLDINMGEFSGIQLLETTKITSQVIIISAYHEYALKGFELNVADYLLKPCTFERFLQAVDRVRNNLARNAPTPPNPARKFIFIKTEYRLEKILLDDILYIEGSRDYRKIFTGSGQIMTLRTFRELEEDIPREIICRVHKSYMVSLDKIDSIEKDRITIRTVLIPVSDTYRKPFLELINHTGR